MEEWPVIRPESNAVTSDQLRRGPLLRVGRYTTTWTPSLRAVAQPSLRVHLRGVVAKRYAARGRISHFRAPPPNQMPPGEQPGLPGDFPLGRMSEYSPQ